MKHKDLIDVVPIMPCQNSLSIMSSKIYGEGRTHIPLCSTPTMHSRIQDRQGLYWKAFPTANHKRKYKFIMDLIPNDWKHLLRIEIFFWEINKEIYFTLK